MANNDLNSIAQEVVLLSQELELAQKTNDWPEVDDILTRFKDAGEKALSLDESVSDKYFLYAMITQPIYDIRFNQQDYKAAGDVMFESLINIQPLFDHLDEERPASIVCHHLLNLTETISRLYVDYSDFSSNDNDSFGESIENLLYMLADFLVQSLDNLHHISPGNPLTIVSEVILTQLQEANFIGRTQCKLSNITNHCYELMLHWASIKSLWGTIKPTESEEIDDDSLEDSQIEIKDNILKEASNDFFKDYTIDYNSIFAKYHELKFALPGLGIVVNFNDFITNYLDYCSQNQIIPVHSHRINIKECVPFCPSLVALNYLSIASHCIMPLHDDFCLSEEEMIDLICDGDAFKEYVEGIHNEVLQKMTICYLVVDIVAERVLIENDELYLSIFGNIIFDDEKDVLEKQIKNIDEEAIVNKMNEYKEALMKCNCLTKR